MCIYLHINHLSSRLNSFLIKSLLSEDDVNCQLNSTFNPELKIIIFYKLLISVSHVTYALQLRKRLDAPNRRLKFFVHKTTIYFYLLCRFKSR